MDVLRLALEEIKDAVNDIEVIDFLVGRLYSYTHISFEGRDFLGVCFTEDVMEPATYKPSLDNIKLLIESYKMADRVLATSFINAISQKFVTESEDVVFEVDFIGELLKIVSKEDIVVFIGNMFPLVRAIKNRVKKVLVFERNPILRAVDSSHPDALEFIALDEANIVVITGATIPNGSINAILKLSKNADNRVIVGPSAQIIPNALFRLGADVIISMLVKNIEQTKEIIKMAGGRHEFGKFCINYMVKRG